MKREVFAVLACAFVSCGPVLATSCELETNAREAFEKHRSAADAIFRGEVTAAERISPSRLPGMTFTFRADTFWKGQPRAMIMVSDVRGFPTTFKVGEKWIVYAHHAGSQLQTSECSRHILLEGQSPHSPEYFKARAQQELAWLGEGVLAPRFSPLETVIGLLVLTLLGGAAVRLASRRRQRTREENPRT